MPRSKIDSTQAILLQLKNANSSKIQASNAIRDKEVKEFTQLVLSTVQMSKDPQIKTLSQKSPLLPLFMFRELSNNADLYNKQKKYDALRDELLRRIPQFSELKNTAEQAYFLKELHRLSDDNKISVLQTQNSESIKTYEKILGLIPDSKAKLLETPTKKVERKVHFIADEVDQILKYKDVQMRRMIYQGAEFARQKAKDPLKYLEELQQEIKRRIKEEPQNSNYQQFNQKLQMVKNTFAPPTQENKEQPNPAPHRPPHKFSR